MDVVITLIVGFLAGLVGSMIVRGRGLGVIGDTIVGIVGAVLGAWLLGLLNIFPATLFGAFLTATIGAVILLLIVKMIPNRDSMPHREHPYGVR